MSVVIPDRQPVTTVDFVRLANCPHCWQRAGKPCTVAGSLGDHLARWLRAERRGLIGYEDLVTLMAGLDIIAGHVIVRSGAR